MIDIAGLKGVDILPITYEITVADLEQALQKQGLSLPAGVRIYTGWSKHWGVDNKLYMSGCPGIGVAAAEWLIKQDPMLLGSDNWPVEVAPNPDKSISLPVHNIALTVIFCACHWKGLLFWPRRYDIHVLPVPSVVIVFTLLAYAVAGMAIGAFSGWLASLITKCRPKLVLRDAFLGSFGFLAGFIGCIFMPWPTNTIVEPLEGGGTVTTTMNTYQHPTRIAVVMAVLLPVFYEVYRLRRARTKLTQS